MLITAFIIFIFGLIFGSFLNVVIYRLPLDQDIVKKRSHCPRCGKTLEWHELIPVLSFFLLQGKCSGCKAKISWQYPAIEIVSGLIWVLVFYKVFAVPAVALAEAGSFGFDLTFGFWTLKFLYDIFILSSLLAVAMIDAKYLILPDRIIYPAIAISLFYNLSQVAIYNNLREYFIWPLLAAGFSFLFFFAVYLFSRGRAMGLGDAKLAILIGLFLGPAQVLVGFFGAFVLGALFGIILIAIRRKKFKSQLAFGPFLAVGMFIAYLMPWQSFLDFLENLLIRFY